MHSGSPLKAPSPREQTKKLARWVPKPSPNSLPFFIAIREECHVIHNKIGVCDFRRKYSVKCIYSITLLSRVTV